MNSIKQIKKFYKTLNTKYLENIDKETQVYFYMYSKLANVDNKIAKKVLQYYNFNEDGTRKFKSIVLLKKLKVLEQLYPMDGLN